MLIRLYNLVVMNEDMQSVLKNINLLLKKSDYKSIDKVVMILKIKNNIDDIILNEIKKNICNIDKATLKILIEETKIKNSNYLKKENNKNFSIYFYESYIKYFFKRYDDIILSFNNEQEIFNVYIDNVKKNICYIGELKDKINGCVFEFTFSIKINQTI